MWTIIKVTGLALALMAGGLYVQGAPKDYAPSHCIWEDRPVSYECMQYGTQCVTEDGMDGVANCWWLDRSTGNVWFVRK